MANIKYTQEDIDRIFNERVIMLDSTASIKKGVIVEWAFIYPNGIRSAFVEASFPVNQDNYDYDIGVTVCHNKIKNKLWEICGQYSMITGEKL